MLETPRRQSHKAALLTLLILASPAGAQNATPNGDPWGLLEGVRGRLAAGGARVAKFEQIYLPAGFSQGETEAGEIALSLPDCLRWDYGEPYPKSFLVCGDLAHAWNSADGTGRRQHIDSKNEPGLDLLLLGVAELRQRYGARAELLADGQARLVMTPLRSIPEVREAVLSLDLKAGLVSGLEYTDQEGNLTRFVLSGYRPLTQTERFAPPAGIVWDESPGR